MIYTVMQIFLKQKNFYKIDKNIIKKKDLNTSLFSILKSVKIVKKSINNFKQESKLS